MKKDYTDILLEDMNHKFDLLLEAIAPLQDMQRDVYVMKEDLEEVKQDVKVIKAAVKDTSRQVAKHEIDITKLKTASL